MSAYFKVWFMILSLLPGLFGIGPAAFTTKKEAETPLFTAAVISDVHTRSDYVDEKNDVIRRGLINMHGLKGGYDCIVMTGDNTNVGNIEEYKILERFIKVYCSRDTVLPAMGNHDSYGAAQGEDFA